MFSRHTSVHLRQQTGNVFLTHTSVVLVNRTTCGDIGFSASRAMVIGILPCLWTYLSNSKFRDCWRLLGVWGSWDTFAVEIKSRCHLISDNPSCDRNKRCNLGIKESGTIPYAKKKKFSLLELTLYRDSPQVRQCCKSSNSFQYRTRYTYKHEYSFISQAQVTQFSFGFVKWVRDIGTTHWKYTFYYV